MRKITKNDVNAFLSEQKDLSHKGIGYACLVDILETLCNDPDLLSARRVMPLYDIAAEHLHSTSVRVERNIRVLLKRSECGMTNGDFIYRAADAICLRNQ